MTINDHNNESDNDLINPKGNVSFEYKNTFCCRMLKNYLSSD